MSRIKKGVNDNFLEPLTGRVKRKPFATVDIESKDGDSQEAGFTRPFLIGVYDAQRREYVEFRDEPHLASRDWKTRYFDPGGCVDKTLSFLLSPQFRGYNIYAHNGGSFDHLFWLAWLRRHMDEFMFEVVPVQSSIQKIDVWRIPDDPDDPIRDRWTFLDSMKLLPMGLDRACKTFGLPGKVDHDLNMHENDPRWSVYLKQDCVALAEVLNLTHDLVEMKLGGEVGMTAPSTSMKLFRRRFLGKDGTPSRIARFAHWPECKARLTCQGCSHEWVRRGYYGGRTEMFKAYGEKLHYYDINSSYVAAMHEDMPVGDRYVAKTLDWKMKETHGGFVECSVEIPPSCKLPPLPHRSKTTGKLMFPTGKFTGVWSTEELALLDDPYVQGRITNVHKVVWFRKKPVFKNMVETLWSLRDKTLPGYDEGLSAMAKLMGNSLYGKFGMKVERTSVVFSHAPETEMCFLCDKPAAMGGGLCEDCEGSKPAMKEPDGDVWYQRKVVDAPYIIPHIAAHITALARVRIWRFMKAAMEAGGEVFYCDTDSVITTATLPSSGALGALKDEYPGKELTGTFVQPKVYMLESEAFKEPKVTMKGFPRKLRTKENLIKLQAGETLSYPNLERVRTLARVGFHRGPQMRDVKKSFKSSYDKRILHEDGSTSPVVLDESDFGDEAAEE